MVGSAQSFGALCSQMGDQGIDGFSLATCFVEPGVKELNENPLCPLVVVGVARAHLAAPVETEADAVQLLAVAGNVGFRRDGGMLAGLDRVLFGRQTKGIVAHGMQNIVAAVALVARDDVAGDVAQGVPHVQSGS